MKITITDRRQLRNRKEPNHAMNRNTSQGQDVTLYFLTHYQFPTAPLYLVHRTLTFLIFLAFCLISQLHRADKEHIVVLLLLSAPLVTHSMAPRISFIQPGPENFPLCHDIYEYVPLPIVTYTEPPIGAENNVKTCRLVRDVTKQPPSFPSNPVCFTLPDQAETVKIFVAAMRGTVSWNKISIIESQPQTINSDSPKPGRTSYHSKIWRYHCPCAGAPRSELVAVKPGVHRSVSTTVNKDGSIQINSKNVKAQQTITTTINGQHKKVVVATEVTGEPLTQPHVKTRQREPSTKCRCPAKFFIRRRLDDGMHEVEWHWKHENHDPFSLDDMKKMRASSQVKEWLSDKVLGGMTWPSLQKLLRNSDLTRVSHHIHLLTNRS